ncbi:hypothetical protein UFOVP708_63 [uncultured Caudovirales phage]|uniref:Uncharacterized protein n=1 Tax=uncultured Caudovirales phage TaxID=2100421 RepID=A0A6J5NPZ7_9CAUD|nr:hypothetical protein UFOVP708_63 [uncultured Caudovirales phage]
MLRQFHARRYNSSSAIDAEFESIVRFLNAAERGGKSLPRLMAELYDEQGTQKPQFEFRFEPSAGLQVRSTGGEWATLASAASLRGTPGESFVGAVGAIPTAGYVDGGGNILGTRVAFADDAIPQAKIAGLTAALASAVGMPHTGSSPPDDERLLWINTAGAAPSLCYFDGVAWIAVDGVQLPAVGPGTGAALKVLRVNAAGSAYELTEVPGLGFLSSAQVGAVGGVAGLDNTRAVRPANLPRVGRRIEMSLRITSNAAVNAIVGMIPTRDQLLAAGATSAAQVRVVAVNACGLGGAYSVRLRVGATADVTSLPTFGPTGGVLVAAGSVVSDTTTYQDPIPVSTTTPLGFGIEVFSPNAGLTSGVVQVILEVN